MEMVCRGIIAVGLFATRSGVAAAYPGTPLVDWGVFYRGSGAQLGIQLLGVLVIAATTLLLNGIGFAVLKAMGCLRVSKEVRLVFPYSLSKLMPFDAIVYLHMPAVPSNYMSRMPYQAARVASNWPN